MIIEIDINIRVHSRNQDTYNFSKYSERIFYNAKTSNYDAMNLLSELADDSVVLILKNLADNEDKLNDEVVNNDCME